MSRRDAVMKKFDEQREATQKRVNEGVEKNRKGLCVFDVVDRDEKEVKKAKVCVKQKSHDFKFGANIFMLDELETEDKNNKYREYFKDLFNMATVPFYWDTLEPEMGKPRYGADSKKIYRRPPIDLCIEYCEKYGIEPREHGLVYDHFFPKWLRGKSDDEVKYHISRRMREISERYADKIPTIEVTNETDWTIPMTDFYNDDEFVEWSFKEAEKYFPNNELVINDGTAQVWRRTPRNRNEYYRQIEIALSKGVRIDAIGMQYHMFNKREEELERTLLTYDPTHLFKVMDKYAQLSLPFQITEVTIPAYSNDKEDEALQAEIIKTLYPIWFSYENVEQIVYWNLVDGYAHVWTDDPEEIRKTQGDMTLGENYYYGGLLRFDMTKKPAYYALDELINKTWHTEEELVTNDEGKASFKGFYGKYDVEIVIDGKVTKKEIHLAKNLKEHKIVI